MRGSRKTSAAHSLLPGCKSQAAVVINVPSSHRGVFFGGRKLLRLVHLYITELYVKISFRRLYVYRDVRLNCPL
jgi:hypothetical protein